jgi:formate C-acetyltransferase
MLTAINVERRAWRGFHGQTWQRNIDVRDFVNLNRAPFEGDESFLVGPTERTRALWAQVSSMLPEERARGGCGLTVRRRRTLGPSPALSPVVS